jgi:hypothetical protein
VVDGETATPTRGALARSKIEEKKLAVAHTEDRVDVSAVRV